MSERGLYGGSLNGAQRSTLRALTMTVLPHLFEAEFDTFGLVRQIEDRLHGAPPDVSRDLATALTVMGSRIAGFVVTGRPSRFDGLRPEQRQRVFDAWSRSPIPVARSVHQALRRLILTTWYATEEARRELGVLPPLHTRAPAFPWEGPLVADEWATRDVVARAPANTPVPRATPHPRAIPDGVITPATFPGSLALKADVVVIGSGAGGAVAAARFAEAHRDVVILEDGDYLHAPDFTERELDMMPRLFADQAMRTTSDGAISLLQGGAVGGGTTVNWMLMLRPMEHVLQEWVHHFHIPGFATDDLTRHLDRVGNEVHAGQPPAEAISPSNRAILDGARALNWRARAAMINAVGCVRAGTCSLGCRYDAKMSGLLTFLPRALAARARLFSGAAVERIAVLERDHGSRGGAAPLKRVQATVRDPRSGNVRGTLTVDAPVVVLAAGAVGTPVILQRSGLGGGGVGRFLRLHPTTAVMGHHTYETYPLAGLPQTALCDEFIRRDANGYGFWIECPALQPALAAAALQGFGEQHRTLMHDLRHTIPFIVLVRDGSGADNSMGSVQLMRSGRVRIRHKLSRADRENLKLGIEAAARLHLAAGATEVISLHTPMVRATSEQGLRAMRNASVAPNRVALFSAHVNGTCRLGVDPASSGCSPTGERHGVRGLFVADGSLLPTAPGVNPQWTIMAMASLLAERQL